MESKWIGLQRTLRISDKPIDKMKELQKYNQFMTAIWPKYLYVALKQLEEKFKTKVKELVQMEMEEDDNAYMDALPITCMGNRNEYKQFENFVHSDLQIEVLRAIKHKVTVEQIQHKLLRESLSNWLVINILSDDEQLIYMEI